MDPGACSRDLCAQFADALAVFQQNDWSRAVWLFEELTRRFVDDVPSTFYLARSRRFAAEPPAIIDAAVIRMEGK